MLLEDEAGVVNLIVPRRVYERDRLAVRTTAFALVEGRLERREGVTNVIASSVAGLATPDPATADVHRIEPPERDRAAAGAEPRVAAAGEARALGGVAGRELAAVAPRGHSFGRSR